MATLLEGRPVAAELRDEVRADLRALAEGGVKPTLATVLMSDDPAARRFMELKHDACGAFGIDSRDIDVAPDAPADRLYDAVEAASDDPAVDAVFVQVPLPERVDRLAVCERVAPEKDVDCFHPANLGRLVAGDPRIEPVTVGAVRRLLAAYDVPIAGQDVTVVGRSAAIGRPLANRLLRDAPDGNATVTVCHTHTPDLAAKTRDADVVVTAAGVPGLVDGSMLREGVTVIDVSANRVGRSDPGSGSASDPAAGSADGVDESDRTPSGEGGIGGGNGEGGDGSGRGETDGQEVVGDIEFESARRTAGAITPVPGGVGPVTLAMVLRNVVTLAERRHRSDGSLDRHGDR